MNRFLRCIDCGEGIMKTPFDQCPEYERNLEDSSEPSMVMKLRSRETWLRWSA